MDKTYRKDAGERGEALALLHLSAVGLKLIKRNHRCKGGEIDLVMLDGSTLVFVEVRFRRDRSFGGAAASVTRTKQQRLQLAARHLLQASRELQRYRARFDLIAIEMDEAYPDTSQPRIEWIKDAFRT